MKRNSGFDAVKKSASSEYVASLLAIFVVIGMMMDDAKWPNMFIQNVCWDSDYGFWLTRLEAKGKYHQMEPVSDKHPFVGIRPDSPVLLIVSLQCLTNGARKEIRGYRRSFRKLVPPMSFLSSRDQKPKECRKIYVCIQNSGGKVIDFSGQNAILLAQM